MIKKYLFTIVFLTTSILMQAQTAQEKGQLEKERQELQKELKDLQQLYDNVKGQKQQTLSQLSVLNKRINLQEAYINNINREIRNIDNDIYLSEVEIYRLSKQLDTLKAQYARSVAYAYKNRSNYDYVNFIFSASSFNDAIKRISYLKSYRDYRESQVLNINKTQVLIHQRKDQQLVRKDQKNSALQTQTKQVQELSVQRKEKDAVVKQLKSKEKELQGQMAAKKKRDRDLQNAILAIVKREIEDAKRKAKMEADAKAKEAATKNATAKTTTTTAATTTTASTSTTGASTTAGTTTSKRNEPVTKPDSYLDFTAKDVALNSSFQANRGKLPWPVDNGYVTLHYGPNKIENTKLTIDNPGLTIATPKAGAAVRAVFEGEVSGIYNLGEGMTITVRHGKYFTTYSNLSSVSVSKGSIVKTGQVIGTSGQDDNETGGQIEFVLMVETKNVDPQQWLRRG